MTARIAFGIIVAVGIMGCGDLVAVDPTLAGSYTLRSVDNRVMPALVHADADVDVFMTAARVDLRDDQTFQDVRSYRVAPASGPASTQSDTATGTYSRDGDKLNFVASSGQEYQMVWQPSRLTYYAEGLTFRYSK